MTDWQIRRWGDFCSRILRQNVDGSDLQPLSVTKDSGVVPQSSRFKKRIATDPRKYTVARDGEFAFDPMSLYYGAIGRVHGLGSGLISPDYVVFAVNDTVDPWFFEQLVRSPAMVRQFASMAEGGAQKGKRRRVYWSGFAAMSTPFPPLRAQRSIAGLLALIDETAAKTGTLIDRLESAKRAVARQVLTRGLPSLEHKIVDTDGIRIPSTWQIAAVGSIANVKTGGRDTKDRTPNGEYPFFVRSPNVERIDSYSFEGEAVLTAGDGAGTGKVFHYADGRFDYHQRVYNVHNFSPNIRGKFFYYYFQEHFFERVKRYSAKNSVDSVRMAMITEMQVHIPSLSEQDKIVGLLTAFDERIACERAAQARLMQAKNGLMRTLFSSRFKLPDTWNDP